MEYATRHLYFPFTLEPLGKCVYEENTSDKWHVSRYPTRKHCITTLSHAQIFGKLMAILESARKSPQISKNAGNTSKPFLENFGKLRKQFKSIFQIIYDFLKFLENLRKSSEAFGNLRKTSQMVQK